MADVTARAGPAFRAFLLTFEAATTSMLNGDDAAWRAHLSAEPGGTLFTPFGGVVRRAPALAQRYNRAAAWLAPGPARLEVEYLSIEVSGNLACVVALERSTFRMAGSDSTQAGFTRVTMIFRREAGAWKLWLKRYLRRFVRGRQCPRLSTPRKVKGLPEQVRPRA